MPSKVGTYRLPEDLFQEFQRRCEQENTTVAEQLRELVDSYLFPPVNKNGRGDADGANSEEILVEGKQLEQVAGRKAQEDETSNLESRLANVEAAVSGLEADIKKTLENLTSRVDELEGTVADLATEEEREVEQETEAVETSQANPAPEQNTEGNLAGEKPEGEDAEIPAWPLNILYKPN